MEKAAFLQRIPWHHRSTPEIGRRRKIKCMIKHKSVKIFIEIEHSTVAWQTTRALTHRRVLWPMHRTIISFALTFTFRACFVYVCAAAAHAAEW